MSEISAIPLMQGGGDLVSSSARHFDRLEIWKVLTSSDKLCY